VEQTSPSEVIAEGIDLVYRLLSLRIGHSVDELDAYLHSRPSFGPVASSAVCWVILGQSIGAVFAVTLVAIIDSILPE
jgi:hypothetical protein